VPDDVLKLVVSKKHIILNINSMFFFFWILLDIYGGDFELNITILKLS
jgi:hypothetical protein